MVERFTFAKTLPLRNLSEGDRRQVSKVCPQGKVLEGSWAKTKSKQCLYSTFFPTMHYQTPQGKVE